MLQRHATAFPFACSSHRAGGPGLTSQLLDAATRAYFEPRFGHDFGRVRIHSDSRAAESAQAVNALAYTVGNHILLRRRRFHLRESREGRQLMAHELGTSCNSSKAEMRLPPGNHTSKRRLIVPPPKLPGQANGRR